jgi:hypothetical protein
VRAVGCVAGKSGSGADYESRGRAKAGTAAIPVRSSMRLVSDTQPLVFVTGLAWLPPSSQFDSNKGVLNLVGWPQVLCQKDQNLLPLAGC